MGTNVSTNYINAPLDPKKTLCIKLPFLVMIIKNLKKYFTFEVQVLDDKNVRRRFRASNYQSTTRVKPFICTMPMRLDEGGIRFSSTCPISLVVPTVPTTLRPSEFKSTPTAVLEGYTSLIGSTLKTSCPQNSNSSCPSLVVSRSERNRSDQPPAALVTFVAGKAPRPSLRALDTIQRNWRGHLSHNYYLKP